MSDDDDPVMHFEAIRRTSPVCDPPLMGQTSLGEEGRTTDPKRVTCPNCLRWMLEAYPDFRNPKFWEDFEKNEARPQVSFSANYKGVVRAPESMTAIAPTGWNLLINGVDKGERCVAHAGDTIEVKLIHTSVRSCAVSPPFALGEEATHTIDTTLHIHFLVPSEFETRFEKEEGKKLVKSRCKGAPMRDGAVDWTRLTEDITKVTCPECLKLEGVQVIPFPPKSAAAVKPEVINHPAHYGGDTTYEVVKVTEAWGFDKDAYLFNVVKYVARGHLKGKQIEDLEKARWYLDRRITNLKRAPLAVACPRCGAPPGTFCVNEKAGPGHIEEPLLLEPEHSHEARKAAA